MSMMIGTVARVSTFRASDSELGRTGIIVATEDYNALVVKQALSGIASV